jgi:hypothetical protein
MERYEDRERLKLDAQQSQIRAVVPLLNTALKPVEEPGNIRPAVSRARNEWT